MENTTAPAKKQSLGSTPEWLTETLEILYTLEAFCDEELERVEVTHDEYISLKHHLAKLRGLPVKRAA
jgi:hypothetical protein